MLQKKMIERFREACHEDARIIAALMFGSFAIGEGDAFSDIEFAVFIHDDSFHKFEQRSWLNAVSPVAAYFPDDFGHYTALFENGIRGEFHFMRKSDIPIISTWQGYGWFPSLEAAVLLDRSGELSEYASALVGGPPIREGAPLVEGLALDDLHALDVPLLVTSSHAGDFLHRAALPWPCAWVLGHEGQGVSPALEAQAALRIRIAQPGGEESLNVAAAAAICLHASGAVR